MMATEWSRIVFESSLRGGLALGLAGVSTILLRRRSGALRHAVWLVGILGLLVAPLANAWLPPLAMPVLPRATSGVVIDPTGASTVSELAASVPHADRRASTPRSRTALPAPSAVWVWLAGAAWMLARAVRTHRQVAGLVADAEPVRDGPIAAVWRTVLAASGVPSATTCRISAHIQVPLACGLLRPTVLLPAAAVEWPDAVLRAVLAHELAHLRRRDPPLLAWVQVVRAIHWYQPLLWLAVRELRAESERACDDAVIRSGERPSRYAETLLAFAGGAAPEPAAALAFWRRETLERRITGILAARRDRAPMGRGQRAWVAGVGLAAIVLLAIVQPVPGKARATSRAPRAASGEAWTESWLSRAGSVEPTSAHFRNRIESPVRIRYAEARIVPLASGRVGITMPELVLENRDAARRVVALLLAFDLPTTRDRSWIETSIAPAGTARISPPSWEWSAVVPERDAGELVVHVLGVRFANGDGWGAREGWRTVGGFGAPDDPEAGAPPEAGETPAPPPGWSRSSPWPSTEWPEAAWPKKAWPEKAWPEAAWPEAAWPEAAWPQVGWSDNSWPEAPEPPGTPRAPGGERAPRERAPLGARAPKADDEPSSTPRPDVAPPEGNEPGPEADARPDASGWLAAEVRNPEGAPVVIVEARTSPRVRFEGGKPLTSLPEVVIENRSDRWVTGLRIRYKADPEGHAVSGHRLDIRPHGSIFIHRDLEIRGRPEAMTVQLLGVRFDDGSVWGTMDSRINTRDRWVYPLSPEGR